MLYSGFYFIVLYFVYPRLRRVNHNVSYYNQFHKSQCAISFLYLPQCEFFCICIPKFALVFHNNGSFNFSKCSQDNASFLFLLLQVVLRLTCYMSVWLYAQVASTAKLFGSPLQGSPNVSVDTPTLQLLDPMQAC